MQPVYQALIPVIALIVGTGNQAFPHRTQAVVPTVIAQRLSDCSELQTQQELNICTLKNYQEEDRKLNRVYQAALIDFSGVHRQRYVDAQVKWLPFRDAECEFAGSLAEGGSMQPMLVAGCMTTLTRQRTLDLQAYGGGILPKGGTGNYQQSDRQLNRQYQQLRQTLSPARRLKLENAELAWITFRDAVCTFEGGIRGKAAQSRCLTRLTDQRTQHLKQHGI